MHILFRASNGIVNYRPAVTAAGQYLTSLHTLSVTPASVGLINRVHPGVEKGIRLWIQNRTAGSRLANKVVTSPELHGSAAPLNALFTLYACLQGGGSQPEMQTWLWEVTAVLLHTTAGFISVHVC